MSMRVGNILRHEDESGISGTGVVAQWTEFSDGEVVVHWLSHTPSTNFYRNIKQGEAIHGHGGKTEMVVLWEEPKDREHEMAPEGAEKSARKAGQNQHQAQGLKNPGPPKKTPTKEKPSGGRKKSAGKKTE